jgi:hypothetical protein
MTGWSTGGRVGWSAVAIMVLSTVGWVTAWLFTGSPLLELRNEAGCARSQRTKTSRVVAADTITFSIKNGIARFQDLIDSSLLGTE